MESDIGGGAPSTAAEEPRDARVVRDLLLSMGVGEGEYDSRVLLQFLEFMYRYVVDVLGDAQSYADHAGKSSIDPDDVRLAIQSKVNFSFSQPPPREVLLELARNRNRMPLPKSIAPPVSIPLPPEQDTLISPNYQLVMPRKQPARADETEEDDEVPNPISNASKEMRAGSEQQQQQQQPQRVSFTLNAAAAAAAAVAAKRPR